MLTVGSLFSGIGGFDLAFARAGARIAWQCEIDPAARSVLATHFAEVPCYADVTLLDGHAVAPVDLICGGFPCQDLSVAGKRAGLAGERSGLWWEFRRVLAEHRPRWVVIENVPGLLSSNGGADFAAILRGLVECGYRCAWRVLDAQYFGVPQRRRRVFIVGYLGDGRAAEVLFERESGAGNLEPGGAARADIARTLTGGIAGTSSHGKPNGSDRRTLVTTFNGDTGGADDNDAQGGHLIAATIGGRMRGQDDSVANNLLVAPVDLVNVTSSVNRTRVEYGAPANTLHQGGQAIAYTVHGEYSTAMTGNGNAAVAFATDRARSLDTTGGYATSQGGTLAFTERTRAAGRTFEAQEDLAYALTNPSNGGRTDSRQIAGAFGVRRLTPLECERLQGFPDGWTAGQSDSARYRQLGNAVAIPPVAWIARRIIAVT